MRRLLALLAILLGLASPLNAQMVGFELPGLNRDAGAYESALTRRLPAGGTPAQRSAAETRAAAAERAGNWAAAVQAWEDRIAAGNATSDNWMALGRAQLSRTPPDGPRALQAAWQAFMMVPGGAPEIPSLLLMAQALQRQNLLGEALGALAAAQSRDPDNQALARQLADARRAAGMIVLRTRVETDADPARACMSFSVPPRAGRDWQPQDWVRAEPAIPGLAVERDGENICVAGLPFGRTTRLVLRAGLPGEGGINLRADAVVAAAVPNRPARIVFDTRSYLLPRGQAPRIAVASVNISSFDIRFMRVGERNLVPLGRDWKPGNELGGYTAYSMSEDSAPTIWQGSANVTPFVSNETNRTILALPDAVRNAGPGLYVLWVKPADGTRFNEGAALPLVITDLGLTAWRSSRGLAVQARSFASATPMPGVRMNLMARSNDILASVETGADGLARFDGALLRGTGPLAPIAIHASTDGDLASLDLEATSFDLSDRGASGRPHPGALDTFLYLDRGIYRPGETVQAMGLIRDAAGEPQTVPVRLRLRRPNNQIAAEAVPPRTEGGAIHWPIPLSRSATVGLWTLEALTDPDAPPIGTTSFRVDAFVPETLALEAGPLPPSITLGQTASVPLTARFLYGAPAAGLSGSAELRLRQSTEQWTAWRGWRIGLADDPFDPGLVNLDIDETDAQGATTIPVTVSSMPDSSRPVVMDATVSLSDPGGRESRTNFTLPVIGRTPFLAIRPAFSGDAINDGAEAAFDIASLSPSGEATSAALRLRLVRETPDWRMVTRSGTARWQIVWRDEPVDTSDLRAAPGTPARFARALSFGRYRLEVTQPGTIAIASYRFRSGWAASDSAEVPDKVDVAADMASYVAGATARVRITSPFAGRASVAVLTDRLVGLQEIDVPAGGAEVAVPVEASWGPGAYVAVTVFRAGTAAAGAPARALGLAWLGLDPAARTLAVTIEGEPMLRPRQQVQIPVRIAGATGSARLTLAAVDEGILRITRFRTPDPVSYFLGRRVLGVDIRDDYGRLIPPVEGEAAVLRQGGDSFDGDLSIQPPQRVVALFSGVVTPGPDGVAMIPLDLPDFAGELRLMAVAWESTRIGAASRPLTVRDQIVAEALLPRFLAPGDEARLPVLLHNVELPEGEIVATLTTEGPLAIQGESRLAAVLATGARQTPFTTLTATGAGEGVIRLTVTGPQGFTASRESRITVRSARPWANVATTTELAPNAEARLDPPLSRFVPGTARALVSFGGAVRYDAAGLLRAVVDYAFGCTEQTSSRLLALASAPPALAPENRETAMQIAIAAVLDRQRFDGLLGLWSASGEADDWVSAYAAEALLRAKAEGALVPEAALESLLRALEERTENTPSDASDRANQAYRLHVLAMAGRHRLGAARRLMEQLGDLPTPLSRAQLASAFAKGGDAPRAEEAFTAALAAPARNYWYQDYGTAARDALAVAVLLKESGLLAARLPEAIGRLPGADFTAERTSTQEQAWAVLAARVLNAGGRPVRVSVDGRNLPQALTATAPLTGPATARNMGDAPVLQTVSVSGLPAQPLPAQRAGMRITRRFFAPDGQPLNLDTLRQTQSFVLLLEATSDGGDTARALIQQGLPAGWEIVGRFPEGPVPGMDFLGELSAPESQPALDDRFAAAIDLTAEARTARVAVRLRAVTAGRFELPGAEVSDMYRPAVFARQATARITIAPQQ
ncbi:alpha-2-macroglobulin family protein [Humitalea sp. 24SJ18S-53]|uniref:alpha-2-macroglobulin family protein n=1 Tax=Humitalea sp. 24SJ18S-53 TaxID=3422307 RepID=UPI003D663ECF